MLLGKSPCRHVGVHLFLALALACALVPASASAALSRPSGGGDLSPRLAELAKPSVRSAPPAKQARELSLATAGAGSLLREGNRVLVEVRFDRGATASLGELRSAGAKIVATSPRFQTVTVAAKPSELRKLSGVPGVKGASPILTPITSASTCPAGVAVSEGDAQLRADGARELFSVDGAGVTVGILSDSFDQATEASDESGPVDTHEAEDVESGDLPGSGNTCPGETTPVDLLDDSAGGEDEGRAMGQIVHDLAPGANLSFASAFNGLTSFASNVKALASAGAKVIVDDVSYFEEPFFQEGPVGVAVAEVSEAGVNYFSSAANNNLINAGKDIASWEAPAFRNSGGCPAGAPVYASECMDFDPEAGTDTTFGIRVSPGATLRVDLQWAQPWNGVTTDLDAYLLNSSNEVIAASEEFNVAKTQRPFEFIPWKNTTSISQTVRLAIDRCAVTCDAVSGGDTSSPRLKFALLQNGGGVTETEYPESLGGDIVGPTIFGHNGAEDAISVGAIRFNVSEAPESFSSRGPVTHYFEPVSGVLPAKPLGSPLTLAKPDIVATDGGANTFFGSCVSHTWRFFGTSAAAPHAAAVAALERQAVPGATAAEVKAAQLESAGPVGAFPRPGPAVGEGIINAAAAIAKLKSEPFSEPPIQTSPSPPENCHLLEPPPVEEAEEKIITTNPPTEPTPSPEPPKPAPQTRFLEHPAKVIRTELRIAKAVFSFGASEGDVVFICRIDKGPFHRCKQRLERRFKVGAHVVRVFARNVAGVADPTPAVFRFRVLLTE